MGLNKPAEIEDAKEPEVNGLDTMGSAAAPSWGGGGGWGSSSPPRAAGSGGWGSSTASPQTAGWGSAHPPDVLLVPVLMGNKEANPSR